MIFLGPIVTRVIETSVIPSKARLVFISLLDANSFNLLKYIMTYDKYIACHHFLRYMSIEDV